MKSLDALTASHLTQLLRPRNAPWFEDDDEPTSKLVQIGALVARPANVVALTTLLADVRRHLLTPGVDAVVVMDGVELGGIITPLDLVRVPAGMACDAMSGAIQAPVTTPLVKAAAMMVQAGVREMVVTREGNVVGLVTALDVTRYLAEL